MKTDKEALLKHHFWLLLGGFALVWTIGLLALLFGAPATIAKEKGDYETAAKGAKTVPPLRNAEFNKPWNEYGTKYRTHKEKVWKKAWDVQNPDKHFLIAWPNDDKAPLQLMWEQAPSFKDFKTLFESEGTTFNGGAFSSTAARNQYKETGGLYESQFKDLDQSIAPAEFKGGKLGFEQIMPPATGTAGSGNNPQGMGQGRGFGGMPNAGGQSSGSRTIGTLFELKTPTVEECLIAQEDYCVKVELLHVIRRALDRVAQFKELKLKDAEKKRGPDIVEHKRFRNDNWEIDLLFEKDQRQTYISAKSTIKNVNSSKRILPLAKPGGKGGIEFLLRQGKSEFDLKVKGEPLAYHQVTEFRERSPCDTIEPAKAFDMEQVFDWSTSPIRRVDEIRLGYNSHRTANRDLKPNPAFQTAEAPEALAGAPSGPGGPMGGAPGRPMGGAPGGPMGGAPGGPMGGPTGASAAGPSATTRENGLVRNRYLFVTDQCRHLPFGMVVVLDPGHIHDLMTALVDSPLRVQITQVQMQHVHGIQSNVVEPAAGDPKPGPGPKPGLPPGMHRPGSRPRPQPQHNQPNQPNQDKHTGGDASLFELSVYGVIPLYERFSEAKTPEPGQPGQPAHPGPSGVPAPPVQPKR